jgi:hypothetical protein
MRKKSRPLFIPIMEQDTKRRPPSQYYYKMADVQSSYNTTRVNLLLPSLDGPATEAAVVALIR